MPVGTPVLVRLGAAILMLLTCIRYALLMGLFFNNLPPFGEARGSCVGAVRRIRVQQSSDYVQS